MNARNIVLATLLVLMIASTIFLWNSLPNSPTADTPQEGERQTMTLEQRVTLLEEEFALLHEELAQLAKQQNIQGTQQQSINKSLMRLTTYLDKTISGLSDIQSQQAALDNMR